MTNSSLKVGDAYEWALREMEILGQEVQSAQRLNFNEVGEILHSEGCQVALFIDEAAGQAIMRSSSDDGVRYARLVNYYELQRNASSSLRKLIHNGIKLCEKN